MSHPPENHGDHQSFDTSNTEGRMNWVFFEFWPVMIWVVVLILICSLPILFSQTLHNPYSSSDVVWWGYSILVGAVFLVSLGLFIVAPRFVAPFTLLVIIYYLIAAEQFKAWTVGNMPWGSSIAILFLTYALIANLIFLKTGAPVKKRHRL